jgi:hypothetical protein
MLEMLKMAFDVHLDDKLNPPFGQDPGQFPGRWLRPSFRPIPLIARQKVCLVDGAEYLRYCQLYQFVLQYREA